MLVAFAAIVGTILAWRPWGDGTTDPAGSRVGVDGAEANYSELIRVSRSGDGDVESIAEALSLSGPGTVIRVASGERHLENVVITESELHRGIHLEADARTGVDRATIAAQDAALPTIQIEGVSDVVLRGFRIEGTRHGAIVLIGQTSDVVIDDVEFILPEKVETANRPAVSIQAQRPSEGSKPIVVRNSRIETPALGQCVLPAGSHPTVADVRLERNCFAGRGVLVLLTSSSDT
jgi:hypothetical protein